MNKNKILALIPILALVSLGLVLTGCDIISNPKEVSVEDISTEAVVGSESLSEANLSSSPPEVEPEVESKLEAEEEEVPVIVMLKEDEKVEMEELEKIEEAETLEEKEEKIAEYLEEKKIRVEQNQEEVLSALAPSEFETKHQYKVVNGFSGKITKEGLDKLEQDPRVENIFLDKEVHASLSGSVPLINADDVWASPGVDGTGQTACIIDTGVDYNHTDLSGKVTGQHCYCTYSDYGSGGCCPNQTAEDTDAMDDHSHGTHVAGIVASQNATYKGTAPGTDIVAIKVLDNTATGSFSDVTAAIDWCVDNKNTYDISLINLSLSDGGEYNDPQAQCSSHATAQAISTAKQAGITTFCASGNQSHSNGIAFPACAPDAVSVGATDKTNPGNVWGSTNSDEILDLMAPGVSIVSLKMGGGTTTKTGTSMATPHAVGTAALMLENTPSLSPEQIRNILKETGVNVTDAKNGLTFPRIDALDAVTFEPTVSGDTSWTGGYQLYGVTGGMAPINDYLYIKDSGTNNVVKFKITWDVDLSTDISIGKDESLGKAFVHNLANKANVEDVTLYIPKKVGQTRVRMCPGATNLDQISSGCTDGFILSVSNPDYDTYHLVDPSDPDYDPDYFIVRGVQDTGGQGEGGTGWKDPWLYRKKITIDHDKVDDNLIDFPLLINLSSDSGLASYAQENGDDILFTESDGTTQLDHEIEKFVKLPDGELVAWVETDLDKDTDTEIYMYYGNAGANNQENVEGVWDSSFKMVQHLEETETGTRYDSTNNDIDGTPKDYNGDEATTGKINGADNLDGSNDYVISANRDFSSHSKGTIELWVKLNVDYDSSQSNHMFPWIYWESDALRHVIRFDQGNGRLRFISYPGTDIITESDATSWSKDVWYHAVVTNDGSTTKMYIDSVLQPDQDSTSVWFDDYATSNSDMYLGAEIYGGSIKNYLNGTLDEVRISSVARSAEWISTSFNNQDSPGTFYSLGGVEAAGGEEGEAVPEFTTITAIIAFVCGFGIYLLIRKRKQKVE